MLSFLFMLEIRDEQFLEDTFCVVDVCVMTCVLQREDFCMLQGPTINKLIGVNSLEYVRLPINEGERYFLQRWALPEHITYRIALSITRYVKYNADCSL